MSMTDSKDSKDSEKAPITTNNMKNIQSINQYVMTKIFKPIEHIIKDVDLVTKEYENIKNKNSNLSRKQRDLVVLFVEQYLPILNKMMTDEDSKDTINNNDGNSEDAVVVNND